VSPRAGNDRMRADVDVALVGARARKRAALAARAGTTFSARARQCAVVRALRFAALAAGARAAGGFAAGAATARAHGRSTRARVSAADRNYETNYECAHSRILYEGLALQAGAALITGA
jgi:hypothetical protein